MAPVSPNSAPLHAQCKNGEQLDIGAELKVDALKRKGRRSSCGACHSSTQQGHLSDVLPAMRGGAPRRRYAPPRRC